jgi:hypothetical protein
LEGFSVEVNKADLPRSPGGGYSRRRKKTAGAIHAEVAWEITTLLGRVFTERKQTGGLELEAV